MSRLVLTPILMSALAFAFDDAIEPSTEGALCDKLLALSAASTTTARATSREDVSALIGFALASRSIAMAFDDDASAATEGTSVTACGDARVACARSASGIYACARGRGWNDGAMRATAREMLRRGAAALASGAAPSVAWADATAAGVAAMDRRGVDVTVAAATTEAAAAETEAEDAFDARAVFYAVADADDDGDLKIVRAARPRSMRTEMDGRTASTLARLREDVESEETNAIEHAFVKPGHEAWVCASATDGKRAYVVVEDTSDTLLRAVRSAKAFAKKSFPDASSAFDLET